MVRRRAVILVAIVVLVVGTVGWVLFGTASRSGQEPPAVPTSTAPSATAPSAGPATPATSSPARPTPSTRATSKPPSAPKPTVAQAEGWRLAIRAPAPGRAIERALTACYEITGNSREPVLELEAALIPAGGSEAATSKRTSVTVGRASAAFNLTGIPDGRYDLRFRLRVDGRWIDGLAVTVSDVRLTADAPRITCG